MLHSRIVSALATYITALVACASPIYSGETSENSVKEKADRLVEMKRQATEYEAKLENDASTELTLHDEPLLRFDNAVSGVPDGILVMWKEGKRPAVFAQVFQTADKLWIHEMQSLASAAFTMRRDNTPVWEPSKAAGDFRLLSAEPRLADSPVRRLSQLRTLAKEFTATDDFKIRASDKETTLNQLRLLSTPVYRYQDDATGVDEGAVFAFVHGTDPELLLVLEHRSSAGSSGWYYALAPMTCWATEAKHNGSRVWSSPERFGKSKRTDDYHVWVYRP
jgi:hypothetical protein